MSSLPPPPDVPVGQVASNISEGAVSIGAAATPVAASVATVAGAAAVTAASATSSAASDVASSDQVQNAPDNAQELAVSAMAIGQSAITELDQLFGDLKPLDEPAFVNGNQPVYNTSGAALNNIYLAAAGYTTTLFTLISFDIFRDFFQLLGLFFDGYNWPLSFKNFWGNIFSVFTLNIDFIAVDFPPTYVFWVVWIIAATCLFVFYRQLKINPDELEDGIFVVKFEDRKYPQLPKYTLVILMTLYLPITRNSIEVFVCHPDWETEFGSCFSTVEHFVYIFASIASLVGVSLWFPWKVFEMTKQFRPPLRPFDSDGHELSEREVLKEYSKDVKAQQGVPYKFVYDGYKAHWSFYKVVIMMIKLNIVLVIIVLSPNYFTGSGLLVIQAIIIMLIVVAYALFAGFSSPFEKKSDDYMDMSARVATVITAAFGLYLTLNPDDSLAENLGILLNVVQILNIVIMLFAFFVGTDKVNNIYKKTFKKLEFSMDSTLKRPLVCTDELDIDKEIRNRVWGEFWSSLFLKHPTFAPPDEQKFQFHDTDIGAPTLLNFQGTVGERLIELRRIMEDQGRQAILEECRPKDPSVYIHREYIINHLVGTDAYWPGSIEGDKAKENKTGFGVLHVTMFPFLPYIVFDEVEGEHAFIRPQLVAKFVEENRKPEIVRRREIRMRILALHNKEVKFKLSTIISNKTGEKSEITFTKGILTVGRRRKVVAVVNGEDYELGPGFEVAIEYKDGSGRSTDGSILKNQHYRATGAEIGITPDFELTPKLTQLFEQNGGYLKSLILAHRAKQQAYREMIKKLNNQKIKTLRNEFYHFVYSKILPRQGLADYLKFEINPHVRSIIQNHKDGLDFLYAKLAYVTQHKGIAFWFIFWHDLWLNNSTLGPFQENEDLLSPSSKNALCYRPMERNKLISLLRGGKQLRSITGKGYFNDSVINKLYFNLDRVCKDQGRPDMEKKGDMAPTTFDAEIPEYATTEQAVPPPREE